MKVKDLVKFMMPFDKVMINLNNGLPFNCLYDGLVSSLYSDCLDFDVIGILSFDTGTVIGSSFGILVSNSDSNE